MSAYLVYSQDAYLVRLFLESQIARNQPREVFRYTLKKSDFRELTARIFHFSFFEGKSVYFLDNAEVLGAGEISFLEKIDFARLSDTYIFHLAGRFYWKILPRWRGVPGLELRELKLQNETDLKKCLKKITSKSIARDGLAYIMQFYRQHCDFKEIADAVLKADLFEPRSQEIDRELLREFLEFREPPEMKYLFRWIKQRNLSACLETMYSLKEQGIKEDAVFLILISWLAKEAAPQEAEFILTLEKRFKTGAVSPSILLLELFLYYCQPEVVTSRPSQY